MTQQIQLLRTDHMESGYTFCVGPFGERTLRDGITVNFDEVYSHVLAPTITAAGMNPVRADGIFGPSDVLGVVWRGVQRAEVVIVDFTDRAPNVAAEFMMALILGKRIIVITQNPEDVPSDVRGLHRYIKYATDFKSVDQLKEQLTLQLQAIRQEPATEMLLVPMPNASTQSVPARVIIVDRQFVMVETETGRRGVLSANDVDYSRIVTDMSRRYSVGESLNGAFDVDLHGEAKYTLLAGQENPWPRLAADYPVGHTFTSVVRSTVEGTGAFVAVDLGINGLLPQSLLGGRTLTRDDQVEVTVTRLDVQTRRVGLRLERVLRSTVTELHPGSGSQQLPAVGHRGYAEVVKVSPESAGKGGFLLLRLEGCQTTAMLHCTQMSPELRADLNRGDVEVGEELYVEVINADATRGRINLKELDDPEESEAEGAGAA